MLRIQTLFRKAGYLSLLGIMGVSLLSAIPAAATPLRSPPAGESVTLLQFTAAGHVLGFESGGLYVAGGDHMLHVGFAGTEGAPPEAAGAGTEGGEAPPLTEVAYADLWPGVSLTYEAASDGIARSTWHLDPGADVIKSGCVTTRRWRSRRTAA